MPDLQLLAHLFLPFSKARELVLTTGTMFINGS